MKLIFLIALHAIDVSSRSVSNDDGNAPAMQRRENKREKFQEDLPAASVGRQQMPPCGSNPCKHGTCQDKGSDYLCICDGSGYKGRNCDIECFEGDGTDYRGSMSVTESGRICQKWASQNPHVPHSCCDPDAVPELKSHNYCRNPNGDDRPWCYTMDENKRWDYCKIPYCSVEDASGSPDIHCFMKHGEEYVGRRSRTLSGRQCQSWSVDSPHLNPENKPSTSNNLESNYCRNPKSSDNEPWCYTVDPNKRWEYCGVPRCIQQGWIDAGMEWCDKNWKASNGNRCKDYHENNWCKRGSERGGESHYGSGWQTKWVNFEKWASQTEYGPGRSALVCPQCGCGSIWLPELEACRTAEDCKAKCTSKECKAIMKTCYWPDYPCAGIEGGYGLSFGCHEGKCWRQCYDQAFFIDFEYHGQWCYTSSTDGDCKRDSDCAASDKMAWMESCAKGLIPGLNSGCGSVW